MSAVTVLTLTAAMVIWPDLLNEFKGLTPKPTSVWDVCEPAKLSAFLTKNDAMLKDAAFITDHLKGFTLTELCKVPQDSFKEALPTILSWVKMMVPIKSLPGFTANVATKSILTQFEAVKDLADPGTEYVNVVLGVTYGNQLQEVKRVLDGVNEGPLQIIKKFKDALPVIEGVIKYCQASPFVEAVTGSVRALFGVTANRETWCTGNSAGVTAMKTAFNSYLDTETDNKLADIKKMVPLLTILEPVLDEYDSLQGFSATLKPLVAGFKTWEGVAVDTTKFHGLLITPSARASYVELKKEDVWKALQDTTFQMDQYVKFCEDPTKPTKAEYPAVKALRGTTTYAHRCTAIKATKTNLATIITFLKPGLDKAKEAQTKFVNTFLPEFKEFKKVMMILYRIRNLPGIDAELKKAASALAPVLFYAKDDALLLLAAGADGVKATLKEMDEGKDEEKTKKAYSETIWGLTALPPTCAKGEEAAVLVGKKKFEEVCELGDRTELLEQIKELDEKVKAMEAKKTRKRRDVTKEDIKNYLPILKLTLAITKPFMGLPKFNSDLKGHLEKLATVKDMDPTDADQLAKLYQDSDKKLAAAAMEEPAMKKIIADTVKSIGFIEEAVCKDHNSIEAFKHLRKLMGTADLDTACEMMPKPPTQFVEDIKAIVAKYETSSAVVSKGSLFLSTLVVVVMALFLY